MTADLKFVFESQGAEVFKILLTSSISLMLFQAFQIQASDSSLSTTYSL